MKIPTPAHSSDAGRTVNRRRFLTLFAAGAGMAPLLSLSRGVQAGPEAFDTSLCYGTGFKPVIQPSDLNFLGVLRVPLELCQVGSNPAGTLSGRVVGGQTRLFMQASLPDGAQLVEFADPGTYGASVASAPRGPVIKHWGDIYGGRRLRRDGTPMTARFDTQIFWDEVTQSIFWSYIDSYAVTLENHPVFGCTQLNGDGSFSIHGPWQTTVGPHKSMRTILRIPQAYADQYLGGRSFAIGAIGTESGNSGSSWGPALFSLNVQPGPGVPSFQSQGAIDVTPLVGYSIAHRCPRDDNYTSHGPTDIPGGWWTQMDGYNGTGCWVDLPDKHGLMYFQMRATGHIWYGVAEDCGHGLSDTVQTTGPHSTMSAPYGYIYDPADLVPVIAGATPSYAVQPTAFNLTGKGLWRDHYALCNGCWFNPATRRLYVSTMAMDQHGCCSHYPIINVFEVL